MLYEVISQPCISVFQFHIKNGFILVKYKIKSSKLHSLLHLALSFLSHKIYFFFWYIFVVLLVFR